MAGRLPHPKTAAEAGSDLTGELQRIYDALTTTRTAKGRRKKDGTLGKGFEQRVVARAEQFFSRDGGSVSDVLEAANEAGFDFADSGDLLSAVYDSVVYGYKRYAARGEGQEVSFSMGDRVRRVPLEEARRVADAFHRVEGMGPVQVDVAGAYEMHLKDALRSVHPFVKVMQERSFSMGGAFEMMDGRRVKVSGRGWREVKNHAADRRNLAALARLDVLAPKAEFLFHAKNSDPKKKDVKAFYYYAVKAVFPGYERLAEVGEGGRQELAYVTIAVAERNSGEFFYDLDSSSVEDIDRVKGTSPNLPLSRVPNTARKGDAPHEHRLQRVKEFVNYADIF